MPTAHCHFCRKLFVKIDDEQVLMKNYLFRRRRKWNVGILFGDAWCFFFIFFKSKNDSQPSLHLLTSYSFDINVNFFFVCLFATVTKWKQNEKETKSTFFAAKLSMDLPLVDSGAFIFTLTVLFTYFLSYRW